MPVEDSQGSFLTPQKASGDRAVIEASYEEGLTSLARLAAFGRAGQFDDPYGDVGARQSQLASDDLVHLAISMRRLIAATETYAASKNIHIPKIKFLREKQRVSGTKIVGKVSLWSLLNIIVHSTKLVVVADDLDVLHDLTEESVLDVALDIRNRRLRPACLAHSEERAPVVFHFLALCEGASRMIEIASDSAAEAGVYLGYFYK